MHLYSETDFPKANKLYSPAREHESCGVGFIAQIEGSPSHDIVKDGIAILRNMTHRGAVGSDPKTGDGAGILIQIPDKFFRSELEFNLPLRGGYGCGNIFFSKQIKDITAARACIEREIKACGLEVLGWRKVPVELQYCGLSAAQTAPLIEQIFISRKKVTKKNFEFSLFRARKRIEKKTAKSSSFERNSIYICSLSADSIAYKGMLLAHQLAEFYPDLTNPLLQSAFAMVHQRFSTNTFPSWKLAHPYRVCAHNGEFNTIQGNINSMRSRQSFLKSSFLSPEEISDLQPIIEEGASDSASFDNALEMLLHTGRSLPHCLTMMIPEAWRSQTLLDEDKRAFYQYHAALLEPFDGPATIAAYHNNQICAILDRNGLRPAKYCITKDKRIIFASEAGVLPICETKIKMNGRLKPGKLIQIDLEKGRFLEDEEVKSSFICKKPYKEWVKNLLEIDQIPEQVEAPKKLHQDLFSYQRCFAYSGEEIKSQLIPMATDAKEALGSMGNDSPLGIFSSNHKTLFNFFRQKFAQVTNPAIDPIREEIVMGLSSYFGEAWNIFSDQAQNCRQIRIASPIIDNRTLLKLSQGFPPYFKSATLSLLFEPYKKANSLEQALEKLFQKALHLVKLGVKSIILSDRGINKEKAPIPILLALSGLHHRLIKEGKRGHIGLIVETGAARLVHHMAVLIGYGASAINPYLALETIEVYSQEKNCEASLPELQKNYMKSLNTGILKIMSKMGISTVRSYKGAQIFEAIGLAQELVNKYFSGTISQLEGFKLEDIEREVVEQHRVTFSNPLLPNSLPWGGELHWRPDGEFHFYNPETIALLQQAVRQTSYEKFKAYSNKIDHITGNRPIIRSFLRLRSKKQKIPLSEVEPCSEIVKRFATGAMSLGSISTEAHENLAIAMNQLGAKSNTGEGGEDPVRFKSIQKNTSKRSAIKQIASGRFGVTTHYLVNADELQIKISQGAKPGEGGQLPGDKVTNYIANIRHSIPGVTLISPPPHHDIYSIEDLSQLIFDLKNVNPKAGITVKLVSEFGVGTVAAGVAKAHADTVIIAGHDGGTGASPITSIKHAGTPWEIGLAETQQTLILNKLRSRIKIQVDGQLKTGRDVIIAALLGAEEFAFATAPLIAQGCIMMRKCHKGTCPVGIATQNEELRKYFPGKPEHIVNFMRFIAEEIREIMASLGYKKMDDLIGKTEHLEVNPDLSQESLRGLQLDKILGFSEAKEDSLYCTKRQDHKIDDVFDRELIDIAAPALEKALPVQKTFSIFSKNRATGAMLSGEVAKRYESKGLPEDTINFHFQGVSGQSFGAFLAPGIRFSLEGMANDYVGKGMSGGKILIFPPKKSSIESHENWIAGNTLLYGATGGEAFISGNVGERFAVRNSGCDAVVEGLGDHGCEYMTGGTVVVIGAIGRNFGAGMSGGIAYLLDRKDQTTHLCNQSSVELTCLDDQDIKKLETLLLKHKKYTNSKPADNLLKQKEKWASIFVKIFPYEYQKVLKNEGL